MTAEIKFYEGDLSSIYFEPSMASEFMTHLDEFANKRLTREQLDAALVGVNAELELAGVERENQLQWMPTSTLAVITLVVTAFSTGVGSLLSVLIQGSNGYLNDLFTLAIKTTPVAKLRGELSNATNSLQNGYILLWAKVIGCVVALILIYYIFVGYLFKRSKIRIQQNIRSLRLKKSAIEWAIRYLDDMSGDKQGE